MYLVSQQLCQIWLSVTPFQKHNFLCNWKRIQFSHSCSLPTRTKLEEWVCNVSKNIVSLEVLLISLYSLLYHHMHHYHEMYHRSIIMLGYLNLFHGLGDLQSYFYRRNVALYHQWISRFSLAWNEFQSNLLLYSDTRKHPPCRETSYWIWLRYLLALHLLNNKSPQWIL